jgi:hypothetical protein
MQDTSCNGDATCKKCRRAYYTVNFSNSCDAGLMTAELLSYQKYWSDKAGLVCTDAQTQQLLSAEANCTAEFILLLNSKDKYDPSTNKRVPGICSSTKKDKKVDDVAKSSATSILVAANLVNSVSAICVGLVSLLL